MQGGASVLSALYLSRCFGLSRESAQGVDSDEDFGVKIAMHAPTQ